MDFIGFWSFFGTSLMEYFFTFLEGLGGPEWSKTVRGARTIILVPLTPHIDHSRPVSTRFCHFWESPIPAYFCQNPQRGAISLFLKKHFCSTPNYLAPIGTCASKFAFDWHNCSAKPLYESRVMSLSVPKPKNSAKSRGAIF